MKYIGVRKRKDKGGRHVFIVDVSIDKVRYTFGHYKDPKEAAKAYDLFIIRKNFDRETNFIKKKLA
jgi:hypothetical protein